MRNPFHRKPAPRRALPAPPRSPGRTSRHGQDFSTTIGLIVVLVLTSAFVAGTTATFTASTRNTGKFTVAGLGKPTTPIASMGGTTATFGYTPASAGADYNVGIGYRILRKSVGGPTTTAGSPSAPDCTAGTYAVLSPGYTQSSSYADPSIPSAAADQGEYFCYAAEGVWPCCPVSGNNPIITSKGGKIQVALQTGYVVSSWSFNTGNNNQQLASGEKLIVNFNQNVNVSTAISASENLCIDPYSKQILLGVTSAAADSCQYEVETLTMTGSPTSGNFKLTYSGQQTANIGFATSTSALETALRNLSNIGPTDVYVTGPTITGSGASKTTKWLIYFANTLTGNVTNITTQNGAPNLNSGSTAIAETFQGTAAEATTLGYLSNSGTYSTTWSTTTPVASGSTVAPARYDISAVAWTAGSCTVVNVSCKQATITVGANLGTNAVTFPTGTWTMSPNPSAGKMTSATSSLVICKVDPSGAPTGGLCKPTATSGW